MRSKPNRTGSKLNRVRSKQNRVRSKPNRVRSKPNRVRSKLNRVRSKPNRVRSKPNRDFSMNCVYGCLFYLKVRSLALGEIELLGCWSFSCALSCTQDQQRRKIELLIIRIRIINISCVLNPLNLINYSFWFLDCNRINAIKNCYVKRIKRYGIVII